MKTNGKSPYPFPFLRQNNRQKTPYFFGSTAAAKRSNTVLHHSLDNVVSWTRVVTLLTILSYKNAGRTSSNLGG